MCDYCKRGKIEYIEAVGGNEEEFALVLDYPYPILRVSLKEKDEYGFNAVGIFNIRFCPMCW